MRFNYSPTAFVCLLGAKIAPLHANTVHASHFIEESGELGVLGWLAVFLIVAGVIIVVGSFFWQRAIDKKKRKW